ncbi:MFS transporter [Salinibacterium sp. ZJ70]|uniref:MFS transporter n=1 Tax=Salinibacterium sp. ZJ70 TaxID=2708084 RepID=UPI001CD4505E|nr:MFS transporter [Salinibacterium sp. ZJ70]
MSRADLTSSTSARRLALIGLYFAPGAAIASWVTRTPAIRDALGASLAEMGLVLFGLSGGSMVGILSSGALVARFGTRPIITAGAFGVVVSMVVIGLGTHLGSMPLTIVGLAIFGAGMGAAEVAMNVEGGEVERIMGRTFLPLLHGCFSLGTTAGAVAGIVFASIDFPVLWHLLIVAMVALAITVPAVRALPSGVGRSERGQVRASGSGRELWRDPRLLLIGVVILAMALAEGSANDWIPLLMVDDFGFDEGWGSAVFAVFAGAMTIGRFAGGPLVDRFGRPAMLAVSAVSAVVGIAVVSFTESQAVAVAAIVLWGLGASLGFPVALSAAGASGPEPARRIALAATAGYVAFLVGPPVLGVIGEEVGLRGALMVPLALAVIGVVASLGTEPRRTVANAQPE